MINLITVFFEKHFKAIAIIGYVALFATIITFQIQKDNLREDVTQITSEKEGLEAFYKAEIERITTKHNQIIKDMINEEELLLREAEIERLNRQLKLKEQSNNKLKEELDDLQKIEDDNCLDKEIPEELKEIL